MLSASGLKALTSSVSRTVDERSLHRLMRFENGFEHDLVEGLLLCHLAVPLGLGYHCRRSAGSSFSLLTWFG